MLFPFLFRFSSCQDLFVCMRQKPYINSCGDVQQLSSAPAQPSVPTSSEEFSSPLLHHFPSSRTPSLNPSYANSTLSAGPLSYFCFGSVSMTMQVTISLGTGAVVVAVVAAGRLHPEQNQAGTESYRVKFKIFLKQLLGHYCDFYI